MKLSNKITQKKLKEYLHYDPETGIFTWKKKTGKTVKIGKIAGTKDNLGYICISFYKTRYLAHRLVWLYMEGYFPEHQIDHINRLRHDNRWVNLRQVSPTCNSRNQKMQKNNKSGVTGICWCKPTKKWKSGINISGKYVHLGFYKSFTKAVHARWKAECKYNWSNCNTTSSAYLYLKNKKLIK